MLVYDKIPLMTRTIQPEPGNVVVKLPVSEYGDIPVPEKQHDSLTWGTVVAISEADKDKAYLMGRTAYWRKYKDDARLGDNLCLIEIKDIMGSSFENTTGTN